MKDHIIRSSFRFLLLFSAFFMANNLSGQGAVSATYTSGSIPTSYQAFDSTCNGNNIILPLTIPAGESYTITGIDINYDMTATGGGTIGQQRSQVKCINTQITEPEASYILKSPGTWHYSRQNVNIANGTYAGGTVLTFEMHAWRTGGTPGCNTLVNRVDNNTWTITLHFGPEIKLPKTGINDANPLSTLDINGKIKMGDDLIAPQAGMMRWNSVSQDFEGYNGTQWLSLTYKGQYGGWGNAVIQENQKVKSWNGVYDAQTDDRFGSVVGIAGSNAIIGKPGTNEVHFFKYLAENWVSNGFLTAPSGTGNGSFGQSVAITENYAIIGSPYKMLGTNSNQGAAYIYVLIDNIWTQEATLISADGSTDDFFGSSVAISSDYAIVGAPGKEINGKIEQGKIYIFKRLGNTWIQLTDMVASDGLQQDHFGHSVSLSGDYAIVGANGKNGYKGCAYVFARNGDTWIQQSILLPSVSDAGEFGQSVGISGNFAIIGAPLSTTDHVEKGIAYVFFRTGSTWSEQAKLIIPDGAHLDKFGQSVSISGDNAIVGAVGKFFGQLPGSLAPDKRSQGKVYVFHNNGTMWQEQAGFTASDGMPGDYFGESISISGNHILVGAPLKTVDTKEKAGAAYFFKK